MKKQLQSSISFLAIILGLILSNAVMAAPGGPPSPPEGNGNDETCTTSNQRSTSSTSKEIGDYYDETSSGSTSGCSTTGTEPNNCWDIETQSYIADCIQPDMSRMKMDIAQYYDEGEHVTFPNSIQYSAAFYTELPATYEELRNPVDWYNGTLTNAIILPSGENEIYTNITSTKAWSTVALPWVFFETRPSLGNQEFYVLFTVNSDFCEGNECETYTTQVLQKVTFEVIKVEGGVNIYNTVYETVALPAAPATTGVSNVVAFPNPTSDGIVNIGFDNAVQGGTEILLFIRDKEGKLIGEIGTQAPEGSAQTITFDLNNYIDPKKGNGEIFYYQIIFFDASSNKVADESGQILYQK